MRPVIREMEMLPSNNSKEADDPEQEAECEARDELSLEYSQPIT